ncbi:MFS transporter [Paenibacillus larvae]|nr:MFS transporter [Paenibacillus larvae]MDT2242112.1 MFS transporter [Paenibacillus larvae]MDT2260738.1 MFS transporter [Paenibacillus larvae]MDT2264047.1 MFS transporter [Paenibacillus larvae]
MWLIGLCLFVAGGLVGSFFSLGLAYASDLLPKVLLPTANVIASINHSLGSVAGPNLGGLSIQYISLSSLFWMLGGIYLIFAFAEIWFKGKKNPYSKRFRLLICLCKKA